MSCSFIECNELKGDLSFNLPSTFLIYYLISLFISFLSLDPTESTPSVMDNFQSGEVQVGRSIELPCIASGYPNPTIRWLKDGRPLPADSRWTRRLTGLTISDLRLEDSGNYICEVTNSFGSKEVTGHLNVIGEEKN